MAVAVDSGGSYGAEEEVEESDKTAVSRKSARALPPSSPAPTLCPGRKGSH